MQNYRSTDNFDGNVCFNVVNVDCFIRCFAKVTIYNEIFTGNMIDMMFKRYEKNTYLQTEIIEFEIIPMTEEEHTNLIKEWKSRALELIRKNMQEKIEE